MRISKNYRKIIFYLFLISFLIIFTPYFWIKISTSESIYTDINKLPFNRVGLVLGTSRKFMDGSKNLFFYNRIKAAALLFKSGKIKHLIVSGDNRTAFYDEPNDMRNALINVGVPDSCITLDCAGLRTFDSVIRCYLIFGQKDFTVISQEFQNERALFIASSNENINAIAFNADGVSFMEKPGTYLREFGARIKCILDIYILNTKPKHLGEKIIIR
ncbi:MAG: vancomycin high temperature exclusion protein [Bacteroidota bacterium]